MYYYFSKFHQNWMKNKKVLLIARFSIQNFKVSVDLWKSYIVLRLPWIASFLDYSPHCWDLFYLTVNPIILGGHEHCWHFMIMSTLLDPKYSPTYPYLVVKNFLGEICNHREKNGDKNGHFLLVHFGPQLQCDPFATSTGLVQIFGNFVLILKLWGLIYMY